MALGLSTKSRVLNCSLTIAPKYLRAGRIYKSADNCLKLYLEDKITVSFAPYFHTKLDHCEQQVVCTSFVLHFTSNIEIWRYRQFGCSGYGLLVNILAQL